MKGALMKGAVMTGAVITGRPNAVDAPAANSLRRISARVGMDFKTHSLHGLDAS
jgi:hypothetical protein